MIFNQQFWEDLLALGLALQFIAQRTKCEACAATHLAALDEMRQGRLLSLEEHEALMCPPCAAALEEDSRRLVGVLKAPVNRVFDSPSGAAAPRGQAPRKG